MSDTEIRKQVLSENPIEWAKYMSIFAELYPNSHLVTVDYNTVSGGSSATDSLKETEIIRLMNAP